MMTFFIGTFLVSGATFLFLLNGFLRRYEALKKRHMRNFTVFTFCALVAVWGLYGTLGSPFSPSAFSYNKAHNQETTHLKVLVAMLEEKCSSSDCVSPKNASNHILLAQTYERLGQHKKSAAVYEKILEYMPEQVDIKKAYQAAIGN